MASAIDKPFEKSSSAFAAELYQKTIEGKSGNVIISPISIQSAVSLAMFGAAHETKAEMKKGLKYHESMDDNQIAKNFEHFTASVQKTNGLKIANKIYIMKDFTPKKAFSDVATKSFHSEPQTIDFEDNEASAKTINDWVEDRTNNKIKDLIAKDSLGSDTRMVLVNAIYFKGFWTYQFDPQSTYRAPFYLKNYDTVDVEFMQKNEDFKYGSITSLDATVLELPYKNSDISMMIILPNKRTGLADVEKNFHKVDLSEISQRLNYEEVNVELPKFKIEFDIKLNEPLQKMGMKQMFTNSANFENLLEETKQFKVSEVVHKAFIEVNEEGAEAAAATGMVLVPMCYREPLYFKANHPFIFALRSESHTHFLGRLENAGNLSCTNQVKSSVSSLFFRHVRKMFGAFGSSASKQNV